MKTDSEVISSLSELASHIDKHTIVHIKAHDLQVLLTEYYALKYFLDDLFGDWEWK